MSALKKLYCPKCGQGIEGDEEVFGQTVLCPTCGHEFEPRRTELPGLGATSQKTGIWIEEERMRRREKNAEEIRSRAGGWESAASICAILGIVIILITLFVFVASIVGATADEPATFHSVGIWIGGSFFSLGIWFYLVAQIMHIRANTEK